MLLSNGETGLTLDILHEQCKRLEVACPGSSVFSDRRVGVDPQLFYVQMRYNTDRPGIGPYVRFVSVEEIDRHIQTFARVHEVSYEATLAANARKALVKVTAIAATGHKAVEVSAEHDGSGEWYFVSFVGLDCSPETCERLAIALCEAGLSNSSWNPDAERMESEGFVAQVVTGFND